jgi:AbrB family looped-hinge helix DNA binding protein
MVATLTSKGQITLPKAIRERLGMEAGDRMDFAVAKDGQLHGRLIKGGVLRLAGIAKPADGRSRTLEEMDEAIALEAAELRG